MEGRTKRISAEYMIQITKKLLKGEKVTCPLCENGIMESVSEDVENSHCFICSSCRKKLNID